MLNFREEMLHQHRCALEQRLRTSLQVREASSGSRRPPPQTRAPVVWLRARWARS